MFSLVICAGCNNTDLSRLLYQLQDWTVFSSYGFDANSFTRRDYDCCFAKIPPVTSQEVSEKQFKCPHPVSTL